MNDEFKIDRKKLLEIGKVKNEDVLDIGAGDLALIAAKEFNCKVTSIDISEKVLEEGNSRVKRKDLTDKVKLEKEDATDLSYDDNSFSTVISYGALHHNPKEKRSKFIEEAFRVCKNKIIISEFKPQHHIHPEDVHPPVNHDWLYKKLKQSSEVKRFVGKEKIVYICFLD
ncbi:MAG: class I SAM-dependent methyltransferase [Thermoplasmatota archaeon]